MSHAHWTMEEYMAGKCELDDVAKPKPPIDTPPVEPDTPARERLRRDAILAYEALGGPEYLRRNPELLDKVLVKMVGDTVENKMDMKLQIELKYTNPTFGKGWAASPAEQVTGAVPPTPTEHVVDVTPKAIESTPANSAPDIASAYQSHLDANKAAREYDNAHPKPWLDKPLSPPPAAPGVVFRTPPPTPGTAAAVEASLRAKGELPPKD